MLTLHPAAQKRCPLIHTEWRLVLPLNDIFSIAISDNSNSKFSSNLHIFKWWFKTCCENKPMAFSLHVRPCASQHFSFHFILFLPCTVTWRLAYLYRWNKSPGKAAAAGSLGQLGNNLISTHLNPRPRILITKNTFQRGFFSLSLLTM